MIGVGRAEWLRLPLPPNRTGGSPASGSPVSGSPVTGLTSYRMCRYKREQPVLAKECIGPTLVVAATSTASAARSLTQNAPQPHANPAVQGRERRPITVFEIFKPAM